MSGEPAVDRILYIGADRVEADRLARAADRFEVAVSATGEDAMERLPDTTFDCVVTEYDLPATTGVDLTAKVRGVVPGLPVVLAPESGSEAIASEAISAGVSEYVPTEGGASRVEYLTRAVETVVEARQRRDRQRLLDAIESADGGIAILDDDGHYEYVNETYSDLFGYEPEELVGEHKDLVYPDSDSFDDLIPVVRDRGQLRREGLGLRADGTTFPVQYTVSTTAAGGFVCTCRDVSDRQRRQAALERKSSLLDSLFDQIPAHLYIKDTEGRHLRVSKYFMERDMVDLSALAIEQYDREHIIGKTDREIYDNEHSQEASADDMQVIESGEPILNREEWIPGEDVWNLTSKVPWRGEDGDIRGIIGISQRITEQKQIERELERKNERLAEFANVLSHDLRNPLQTARGRIEILQGRYDDEQLEVVDRAHERMASMIDDILLLARDGKETNTPEPIDLATVIRECWDHVATDDTEIIVETDRTINADRSRLKRLFENLVSNAVAHGGPVVTVGDLEDGGFYFEDDGRGIPHDEREAVFEAGRSGADESTGFGLSIVEQIAELHGWTIDLTDSNDGGARFEFRNVDSMLA